MSTPQIGTWQGLVTLRAINGTTRTREHFLARMLSSKGMTIRFVSSSGALDKLLSRLNEKLTIVEHYVNGDAADINGYLLGNDNGQTVINGFVNICIPSVGEGKSSINFLFADIKEVDEVYNYIVNDLLDGCEDLEKIKFNYVHGYDNQGNPAIDVRTFDSNYQVPSEAFYPYISGGHNKFITDFFEADSNLAVFIGEPGTGKSTLLRQVVVSAVAAKRPVYQFTGEKVIDHPSFDSAIAGLPEHSLVIIEDADSITGKRTDGNRSLSSLLNEINGISNKDIKFVITTNLPTLDAVDPALVRVGRLFRHIHFRKLTADEAFDVLKSMDADREVIAGKNYTIAELLSDGEGYVRQGIGFK